MFKDTGVGSNRSTADSAIQPMLDLEIGWMATNPVFRRELDVGVTLVRRYQPDANTMSTPWNAYG